eukprot:scaffold38589_cov41-Cyclotella_meneghiniana.AAC.5
MPFVCRLRSQCSMSENALSEINIPSNMMAFYDLTPNKSAPQSAKALLGLGSKFICTPKFTTGSIESNFSRLERDMHLRVYLFFACGNELDESPECDKSKLYVKSDWRPSFGDIPVWVDRRLSRFYVRLQRLKKKKATPNLLPFQARLFEMLSERWDLLFPEAEKGLGPCAVLYEQYIEDALIHLLNENVYQQLSEEEAAESIDMVSALVDDWLKEYQKVIGKTAYTYIRNHLKNNAKSPFGQFHKGMKDGKWPTRLVCSDVTGLLHGLAKWVTEELLPLATKQPSYFKALRFCTPVSRNSWSEYAKLANIFLILNSRVKGMSEENTGANLKLIMTSNGAISYCDHHLSLTGGNIGFAPDLAFPEKEVRDLSFAEEELQSTGCHDEENTDDDPNAVWPLWDWRRPEP